MMDKEAIKELRHKLGLSQEGDENAFVPEGCLFQRMLEFIVKPA